MVGTSAFADREVGPVGGGTARVLGHLSKAVPPSRLADELLLLAGMVGVVRRTLDAASARLSPEAPSARQARRFVDETLRRWECDDLLDTVELLVSELVTNAVIHARSDVDVSVQLLTDRVRIEVADQSPEGVRRRERHRRGQLGPGDLDGGDAGHRLGRHRHPGRQGGLVRGGPAVGAPVACRSDERRDRVAVPSQVSVGSDRDEGGWLRARDGVV